MAINFEAANMAGYNNPKIEVFKATLEYDDATETYKITEYPPQPTIAQCIKRGSIPFILMYLAESAYLLALWSADESGTLVFLATSKKYGEHTIVYDGNNPNNPPVYQGSM